MYRAVQALRRYLLDRMVLRPTRHSLEHHPQQRHILRDGTVPLECFIQRNFDPADGPPQLLVLKFPGTAGRGERSSAFPMALIASTRVEMWTWNPPGYGASGGRASLAQIAAASLEFWSQVVGRFDEMPERVWLCGNSLGSVVALNVAATVRPEPARTGLLLRNPPPLRRVVRQVARRYPFGRFVGPITDSLCESMDAMQLARRVDLPAVFLQSELDRLVPLKFQNELIEAYRGPRHVVTMEGLDHSCPAAESHQALIESAVQWLWDASTDPAREFTSP